MSTQSRGLLLIFLGFALSVQFMNCSSYSDGLNAGSITDTSTGVGTITAYQGVRVTNGDTYMNCDEDHVQLGGTCNTADAFSNYIEAKISINRNTVYWGTGSAQTDHLDLSKCENGRFFAVIPKPNDVNLAVAGSDYLEYQVTMQMFTSTDGQSYTAGEVAPSFTVEVQKNGGCQ